MSAAALAPADRWARFTAAVVRGYHAYGSWLVSISWRRFILLAVALLVIVGIVHDMPPFTWRVTEHVQEPAARVIRVPPPAPRPVSPPRPPGESSEPPSIEIRPPAPGESVEIRIGREGVRIGPRAATPASAAPAAAASAAEGGASAVDTGGGLSITLPPEASDAVRRAIEQARREIEQAKSQARREADAARRDAESAARDAEQLREQADALARELEGERRVSTRVTRVGIGDLLQQLTLVWVMASAVLKFTYKGRLQAEAQAAQATETAEAESLKRQVVEARMAAMQAQIEPHFLFNTLASIDHLIETDPRRASAMQKNLIALLRASMPTMREASDGGVRDLGRELAVIRPYLEILKVRMEERLTTDVTVPEGLLSAEFPPMMIQTLVENAIKHGLEPKADGGHLRVAAEIVHGKLQVTVADTGLGFGKAATAGTGVGLANIRERLQMLYGPRAALTVTENTPSGVVVTVTVPYRTVAGTPA